MTRRQDSGRRTTASFVVFATAISWACWLPLVAAGRHLISVPATAGPTLVILGTLGPFLAAAAIVSSSRGATGLRDFLAQAVRWRVPIFWYLAALAVPALIRFIVIGLDVWKGGTVPDLDDPARWLAVPATFVIVLFIGGPFGEEFGWRGFLLARLQAELGVVPAATVIGVISVLWHLPLFWIAIAVQSHLPFAIFALRTLALSIVSSWLYNGSRRSLLIVLLFHASLNTWPNTVFIVETTGTIGPYLSATILYAAWAGVLVLLGLIRTRRHRRDPAGVEPIAA